MTTISFSLTLVMLIITIIGMSMAINKIGLANSVLSLDKNKINRRNEQILKAARDYVSGVTLSSPSNVLHFEAGAKWADKNPINLWHNVSEEPKFYSVVLCLDNHNKYWVVRKIGELGLTNKWYELVNDKGIIMWAYIDDLLPKQFGNSERLKGEHNGNND